MHQGHGRTKTGARSGTRMGGETSHDPAIPRHIRIVVGHRPGLWWSLHQSLSPHIDIQVACRTTHSVLEARPRSSMPWKARPT